MLDHNLTELAGVAQYARPSLAVGSDVSLCDLQAFGGLGQALTETVLLRYILSSLGEVKIRTNKKV